jgi:methylmalonyl-CoA/ethylmalonyl-CoA epimerase
MKFDHLGLVVPDLKAGRERLSGLFEIRDWTREFEDPVNNVYVQFGRDASGMCYELVAPLGSDSPVAGALKNQRAILNHVAYLVSDLPAGAERLSDQGCMPIGTAKPAIAYGGRSIQFFATPLHFIVELIEAPDHAHRYLIAF